MIHSEPVGATGRVLTCDECGWTRHAPNRKTSDRFEQQHAKTHAQEA